jgi:hypothetical protein
MLPESLSSPNPRTLMKLTPLLTVLSDSARGNDALVPARLDARVCYEFAGGRGGLESAVGRHVVYPLCVG